MAQREPLSRTELKKMTLRVMYELQFGKMSDYASGMNSIVPYWINEYYGVVLTGEEKVIANSAVVDLKAAGLIIKDAAKDDEVFQVLTTMGKIVVEKNQDPDIPVLKLDDIVKNTDLLEACLASFNKGDYQTAVASSFECLEKKMSKIAQLSTDTLGFEANQMNNAFGPISGKPVTLPRSRTSEQEEVYGLLKKVTDFFGNPLSHRLIDYGDRLEVIKTIAFAELLLGILAKAESKT